MIGKHEYTSEELEELANIDVEIVEDSKECFMFDLYECCTFLWTNGKFGGMVEDNFDDSQFSTRAKADAHVRIVQAGIMGLDIMRGNRRGEAPDTSGWFD